MRSFKKLAAVIGFTALFNPSFSQTFNYDISLSKSFLHVNVGSVCYDSDNKKLDIFMNILGAHHQYYLINDSTYFEKNETRDYVEEYYYSKKNGKWVLDNFENISGKVRSEKKILENKPFDKNSITTIQTLDEMFSNSIKDTTEVIIAGLPFTVSIFNKANETYDGEIIECKNEEKKDVLVGKKAKITKLKNSHIPELIKTNIKFIDVNIQLKNILIENYSSSKPNVSTNRVTVLYSDK